jgi:hypothetical protein
MSMDVVEYRIEGAERRFVEVEFDPGEAAVGEAGSLLFMDAGIHMDTVFGDGRHSAGGGFFGKRVGAGKRPVTGESRFTTVYTSNSAGKRRVAFAAPAPAPAGGRACRSRGGPRACLPLRPGAAVRAQKACCWAGWPVARCSAA